MLALEGDLGPDELLEVVDPDRGGRGPGPRVGRGQRAGNVAGEVQHGPQVGGGLEDEAAAALARSKAYLTAVTGRHTMAFANRMEAHPIRFDGYQSILARPLFPGPGAVPIKKDGKVVGGFASSVSSNEGGM